jgi:HK97 gp10 family phage protein
MPYLKNWNADEVFGTIREQAIESARNLMDEFVIAAKAKCPIGTVTREGKFVSANVSFTPKRGPNRGEAVHFTAENRWTGRYPGQLRDTIRRVEKASRPANLRVYAGNFKVYYAHMVEYGTVKSSPHSFMRNTFADLKTDVVIKIENRMAKNPEVVK